MRHRIFYLLLLFASNISLFSQTLIDQPVAIVNLHKMEVISQKQFENSLEPFYRQLGDTASFTKDQKLQVLNTLVNQKLILQDCNEKEIKVSDEDALRYALYLVSAQLQQAGAIPSGSQLTTKEQLESVLKQQNIALDKYIEDAKNQLLVQKYVQQTKSDNFKNMPAPTEEEIKQLYQIQITKFARSESVHYSHIYFNTQGLDTPARNEKKIIAEETARTITSGSSSFEAMVRKYSEDEASRMKNGYAGIIEKAVPQALEKLGQEFLDALFDLPIGQVSQVLESKMGFHIVRVSEKNEARLLTLDDAISESSSTTMTIREYLSQYLSQQKQESLYQELLAELVIDLRKNAEQIKIFEELL